MRGVHALPARWPKPLLGSSPHARGPRLSLSAALTGSGIIPACAGSTVKFFPQVVVHQDHPRMRGVHTLADPGKTRWSGSSPHARGPLHAEGRPGRRYGIIPACAGSTNAVRVSPKRAQDHPRMRGVHSLYSSARSKRQGSSPHARGPPQGSLELDLHLGIIPACAGSTFLCHPSSGLIQDHPRMRGVHFISKEVYLTPKGSSPHARGPPGWKPGLTSFDRIIPACAGSTTSSAHCPMLAKDHPRMRGVHQLGRLLPGFGQGSSPHARGPLILPAVVILFSIIPACAGSTHIRRRRETISGDHPRMRGVHPKIGNGLFH